jgi:hypothetical protein
VVAVTHTVTGLSGLTGGDLIPDSIIAGFDYDVALNAEGNGGLVLPYGQSLVPFAMGRVVVVRHDGTPVASWVIDDHLEHPVAVGEESQQLSEVTGLSLAGLLSRYLHRDTLGYDTSPWSLTRTWSAFSRQYTGYTSWGFANTFGTLLDSTQFWDGLPDGFPAFDVERVGPSEGTDGSAPQGYWWYLDPAGITLGERTLCSFFVAADNSADFYVAGFRLGKIDAGGDTTKGFRSATRFDIVLDAGTHPVGMKVVNTTPGGGDPGYGLGPTLGGNPTFAMGVGFTAGGDGRLGDRIWETSAAGRVLSYVDDPPGMTLPEIVETIVEENWLDGILPLFTVSSTGTFPELESVTADVDRTLLELLRDDWAPAGLCDWRVPPTALQIQLEPAGALGAAQDVTYEVNTASPMHSSLRDLSIRTIDEGTDCLMVGWDGGWLRVPATGGSRMQAVRTAAATPGEARAKGEAILARSATPEQYTIEAAPTGVNDVPGVDFDAGDSIAVEGSRERVIGWGGHLSPAADAVVRHTVVLKDRIRGEDERVEGILRRTAPGQRADAPTQPASVPPPLGTTIRSGELEWTVNKPTSESYTVGEVTHDKIPTASGDLYAFRLSLKALTSGTFTVLYKVDGTTVATASITTATPNLSITVPLIGGGTHFLTAWTTRTTIEITSVGVGADGLVCEGLTV